MDMTHRIEKWAGRLLLWCGVGFMLLISVFAVNIIASPQNAHNPLLIGGFIGGFMLLGAPLGLLLPFLRRINHHKDKQHMQRQFTWMDSK